MEQPQKQRTGLRAGGPKQLVAWLFSGTLLVAALVLAGKKIFFPPHPVGPICSLPPTAPTPEREKFAETFQEAKTFIRQNKWKEARDKLRELQAVAPEDPGVKDYLEQVEKEIPNQQHLTAAREALAQKMWSTAKAELDLISPDTTMFEEVSKLRRALGDPLDARVREAQKQFAARQYDQAQTIVDEILAVSPAHPGALALSEQLRRMNPADPINSEQLSEQLAIDGPSPGPNEPGKSGNMQMGTVKAIYSAALMTKSKRQWARTLELVQHILVLDPKHAGAHRIIKELRQKAMDLSPIGYVPKDTNPEDAIPRYREIMELTLPDDELHQKAKNWLEKMEK